MQSQCVIQFVTGWCARLLFFFDLEVCFLEVPRLGRSYFLCRVRDSSICWVEGGLPQFGKREFGGYGGESVAVRRYPYHEHVGFLEMAGLDCSYVLYARV